MTPEKRVKEAVKKRLEYYGVLPFVKAADAEGPVEGMYWFPIQGHMSIAGVHDVIGCWRGVFFSIETKAPNNRQDATEPQRAFHAAVTKAGGVSYVGVRDASVVDDLARRIKEMT